MVIGKERKESDKKKTLLLCVSLQMDKLLYEMCQSRLERELHGLNEDLGSVSRTHVAAHKPL